MLNLGDDRVPFISTNNDMCKTIIDQKIQSHQTKSKTQISIEKVKQYKCHEEDEDSLPIVQVFYDQQEEIEGLDRSSTSESVH